jgi:hypothetical protein
MSANQLSTPRISQVEIVPGPLRTLNLTSDELDALRRQGVVSQELRGRNSSIYKLRFRFRRRQKGLYLGSDREWADVIRGALEEWQQGRRRKLELDRKTRAAGQLLRTTKQRLASPLQDAGFHFHGRAIRRQRGPPPTKP